MKFRKRPIIVDAEQYLHPATAPRGVYIGENGDAWVVPIHGQRTPVVPGDWIIQERDGEHYYPCKPDVFANTYEPFLLATVSLVANGVSLEA